MKRSDLEVMLSRNPALSVEGEAPKSQLPVKLDREIPPLEREEQRKFALWCRAHGLGKSMIWHSTAHRTKNTLGCPDFVLAVACVTLYIEFKLPGKKLSPDQEAFALGLEAQGHKLHVVYNALGAQCLVEYISRT